MNKEHWEQEACPKYDCRKENCKCGMKRVFLATALGDDSEDSPIAPKNGAYCNAIVVYEANEHVYIYSTEGIPTLVESNGKEIKKLIEELEDGLAQEILDRQAADNALQQEIDDIKSSPDVVDIVATYAALQAYDTSHLGDNDIIRVLADETHDGQSTYYRWNKTTSTWTYIGAVGDYYTKGQVDNLLATKQNTLTAGTNVQISAQNVISATDTTYSNFVGTDGVDPGTAGLVPAPATTDAGKFLKADGTWDVAGGTPQYGDIINIGPSNTVNSDVSTGIVIGKSAQLQSTANQSIRIGTNGLCYGPYSLAIGYNAQSAAGNSGSTVGSIAIGRDAVTRNGGEISIGASSGTTSSNLYGMVNLGAYSSATRSGEVNVGSTSTTYGYNSTNYRVIGGVHDGQTDHDAVTLGQLNVRVKQNAGAPTTSTVGTVGQLLEDTTNGKLYQCTAIDTTDPNNPSYTWTELGGGDAVYYNNDKRGISIGNNTISSTPASNGFSLFNGEISNNSSGIAMGCGNSKAVIGSSGRAANSIAIGGSSCVVQGHSNVIVGRNAYINPGVGNTDTYNLALGGSAYINGSSNNPIKYAVALGANSAPTRTGEVNVGVRYGGGYNNSNYRVIGGVHNGVDAHDAATVAQAVGITETFTKATSDWTALAASSPYTYSTTVTLATTLSASSEVELINDQLVAFANYGFGILSITGQVATIASIGQPDSSITFKIKVRG